MKKYNENDFVVHCSTVEEHRIITTMYPNGCNTPWTDVDFELRQCIRICDGLLYSHNDRSYYEDKKLDILEASELINKEIQYEIY